MPFEIGRWKLHIMSIVYIGIGSNLGNREDNIRKAIDLLEKSGMRILKTSTIIETDPVGGPPQGKFLNAVMKVETVLSPEELLKVLLSIESNLGRIRTMKNEPRTIDLDILLYDALTLHTPHLTIPHPRMLERDFVMQPLKEIEPHIEDLIHAHHPHH